MDTISTRTDDRDAILARLHPLSLSEILDLAICIYRQRFATLVGIAAIISIPLLILQIGASLLAIPTDVSSFGRQAALVSPNDLDRFALSLGGIVFVALLQGIGGVFQVGAITAVVSQAFMGHKLTIRQAYRQAFRRWFALLVATLLIGIANFLLFGGFMGGFVLVGVLSAAASPGSTSPIASLMALGMCVLALPLSILALYLNIRWSLTTPAIVLEGTGGPGGLGRSWRLIGGSFWRMLFALGVLAVLVYVLTTVPAVLIQFAVTMLAPRSVIAATSLSSVATMLLMVIMMPLQSAVLTLLYYDLRIRREGFDLQVALAQSAPDLDPMGKGTP